MKLLSSTKIAIGFASLFAAVFGGYQLISDQMIMKEKFVPLVPKRVNLVGVAPAAGYRIVVANDIATLVKLEGDFGASESGGDGPTEGAIKKRLPIKEMLQSLQGDTKALSSFVMNLNDIKEDENWPTIEVLWKAEDLEKALNNDAVLRPKLELDIAMRLDGGTLSRLRTDSLSNGIVVDVPVPVTINIEGRPTVVIARVKQPYKPRFIKGIDSRLKDKFIDTAMQIGTYADEARLLAAGEGNKEDIKSTLKNRISEGSKNELTEAPSKVLSNATIVVNEQYFKSATYEKIQGNDGKYTYDLRINLTDEGRRRLWQFTKHRVNSQILLTVDGVGIAAPRILHELNGSDFVITQLRDEVLVREAVDTLNSSISKG